MDEKTCNSLAAEILGILCKSDLTVGEAKIVIVTAREKLYDVKLRTDGMNMQKPR